MPSMRRDFAFLFNLFAFDLEISLRGCLVAIPSDRRALEWCYARIIEESTELEPIIMYSARCSSYPVRYNGGR